MLLFTYTYRRVMLNTTKHKKHGYKESAEVSKKFNLKKIQCKLQLD